MAKNSVYNRRTAWMDSSSGVGGGAGGESSTPWTVIVDTQHTPFDLSDEIDSGALRPSSMET